MKRIFINMLIVSVLATNVMPVVNVMAAEKSTTATTVAQEGTEVQYKPVLEYNEKKTFDGSKTFIDLSEKLDSVKDLLTKKLIKRSAGYGLNLPLPILELMDINPETDILEIDIEGRDLIIKKENYGK